MRIFFDTEFFDTGTGIELISIGMVHMDGRELYLESSEVDLSQADDWMRTNVIPHLRGGEYRVTRAEMARRIKEFARPTHMGMKTEFWARYADYDWVALCQLYGRMLDIPNTWSKWCRDLKQLEDSAGFDGEDLPEQTSKHDALSDARWNRVVFDFVYDSGRI